MALSDTSGNRGRGCCLIFPLLAVSVGTFGFWRYRFSPPTSIVVTQQDDRVLITNRFLEYWIGLNEIQVINQEGSEPLLWAHTREGAYTNSFMLFPGDIGETVEGNKNWNFIDSNSPQVSIDPGETYEVRVWGNNGFGHFNEARVQVIIPDSVNRDASVENQE